MATRYSAVRNPASSLWSRFQHSMTPSIPSILLSTRFMISNISWKQESGKQEPEKLMQDQETLRSSILQRCYAREHPEIWPAAIFLVIELYLSLVLLSFALAPSMVSEKKARST